MNQNKNAELRPLAQALRTGMTPQERHLWYDFLKDLPMTVNRQKVIDRYIVDFYCHKARLVIEIDGSQHYTPDGMEYDGGRTAYLEGLGFQVLRISNADVDRRFRAVCEWIDQNVKARMGKDCEL